MVKLVYTPPSIPPVISTKVPVLGSRCHITDGTGVEAEVLVKDVLPPLQALVLAGFVVTTIVLVSPT